MTACFADTFYFLGLLNPNDETHERALAVTCRLPGPMVTTAWVLTEVADAMAAPENRSSFLELLELLRSDPQVVVVPPGERLFDEGVELFRRRPDKGWSLTDCISFVVMEERGIRIALTGDRHFEQAGFQAFLK